MFSPLLQGIIDREGFAVVGEVTIDAMTKPEVFSVLFFPGDAARLGESNDVAVVLPELVKAFEGNLTAFVVDSASDRALQRRYRFNAFPALVFLRNGEYLGVIQGIMDWTDYLVEIAEILQRDPSDPPPFKFPEGCAPQSHIH